jgi:hypothetical protein
MTKEEDANSRLIAAAPELLAALEGLTLLISNVAVLYGNDAAKWLMASTAYQKAIEAAQKAKGL